MSDTNVPYFGRHGRPGLLIDLRRRAFRPGLLAVVARTCAVLAIDLSDAVPSGTVAAVRRHLDEAHPIPYGAVACYAPCPGALALLPPEDEPSRSPAIVSNA